MTYRRWVVPARGGPDVMKLVEEEVPEPAAGEVRLRVLAAGVAFGDVLHRRGFPGGFATPFTPGYDAVGLIDALGAGVAGLEVGQRVAALPIRGGYAEHLVCPAEVVVPLPPAVEPTEAAAVVLNYLCAHQMLHRVAHARRGERILVHGAAGGVGTALLELARLEGISAVGAASRGKHPVIEALNATPIDSRAEGFEQRIGAMGGFDVVFDGVGGRSLGRSYRCLRPGGRLVMFGVSSLLEGGGFALITGLLAVTLRSVLFSRGRRCLGYSVVDRRTLRNPHLAEDLGRLLALLAEGRIRPVIAARLPLVEAPRAQALLEAREVAGKIVLTCPA